MKKLSVKKLIEFRKKSDRAKKTFVANFKSNKVITPTEGGGDYWVSSLSAISNSYRQDSMSFVDEKITELKEKISNTKLTNTKNMYLRNIEILQNYQKMNLKKMRPLQIPSFLKKSTGNTILTIKGLEVETQPNHIYLFGNKGEEKVGAIWFTAKVNGYRIEEVGMFCDMLYRFLKHNYSKKYEITSKYCIAVDVFGGQTVDYSKIEDGSLQPVLNQTLDEINKLM